MDMKDFQTICGQCLFESFPVAWRCASLTEDHRVWENKYDAVAQ